MIKKFTNKKLPGGYHGSFFDIKEDVCTDGWVVHLGDLSVQGKRDKLKC